MTRCDQLLTVTICVTRERMGDDAFDEDEVVPIKQVWKWIFPKKMEAAVGKRFVTGDSCQFYVELQVGFCESHHYIIVGPDQPSAYLTKSPKLYNDALSASKSSIRPMLPMNQYQMM